MKKPIDPNLNNFADDLESMLDDGSSGFSLNADPIEQEDKNENKKLEIEIKKNHYSGESSHHHSSHSTHHHGSHHSPHGGYSHGGEHSEHSEHRHHSGHHRSAPEKKKKERKKLPVAARIAIAILLIFLLLISLFPLLFLNTREKVI